MFTPNQSLKDLAQLAHTNGMRMVAVKQRVKAKVSYSTLSLADVSNVIKATNEGLLFKDEMNAIVTRFNRQDGPVAVVYVNEQGLLDYMVSL